MSFRIIRDDITRISADAIVNTANPNPVIGSGTDTAIYEAAGKDAMLDARKNIGKIEPGEVGVTPGFNLNAKYVIHTVGPIWNGGESGELDTLAACYRHSLLLADKLGCESIAFPLLSTGNYGVPKDRALETALHEIESFLRVIEMDITLVVFDRKSFELSSDLIEDVEKFIDENYVDTVARFEYARGFGRRYESDLSSFDNQVFLDEAVPEPPLYSLGPERESLDAVLNEGLGQTFQEKLLTFIDSKGYTDTEVYKRANIDRKVFSKIRCNVNYQPKKKTALALVLALRLNIDEAVDLLGRAGLAFSPSDKRDVIVQYCIMKGIYNIFEVDALLFNYDLQTLG